MSPVTQGPACWLSGTGRTQNSRNWRRVVAAMGGMTFAVPMFFLLASQAQSQTQSTACRLLQPRPDYTLRSDTVEWEMEIAAGHSCVRGVRSSGAIIDDIKLVTAPRSGRVTLQGPAFYYRTAPNFQGADPFELRVTGKMYGIAGSSTVRVLVLVR